MTHCGYKMKNRDSMRLTLREYAIYKKNRSISLCLLWLLTLHFKTLISFTFACLWHCKHCCFPFCHRIAPLILSIFNCILQAVPSWFGPGFEGIVITVFGDALIYFQPRGTRRLPRLYTEITIPHCELQGFGTVNSPLCTDAPLKAKEKQKASNFQDFAEFLPLPNVVHLPASGSLKA